jgi:hypothetical protein
MKDSPRWDFFTEGSILDVEDETKYAARRVRDRLSCRELFRYVETWGAPIRDPGF